MKIYSALYDEFYPFAEMFPEWKCIQVGPEDSIEGPGILVIWGGGDIHPSLYLRDNVNSYVGPQLSQRDQAEAKLFLKALNAGVTVVGVCRGAQIGCALTGGILIQNVSGHENTHLITTIDGKTFASSSLHHQMMYPWGVDHDLIAWTNYPKSHIYEGITDTELEKWPKDKVNEKLLIEPEIVWFPTTKCLALQGHPEMMQIDCLYNQYIKTLISEKCQ